MKVENGLGIKTVTTWLPEHRERASDEIRAGRLDAEAVDRKGVVELPAATELAPPEMAVLAGRRALDRADWEPSDIGLLTHAWVYHQGYEKWSPAHCVADGLGLPPSALPVGLQEICHGGTTGMVLAAAMLVARPEVRGALVTTADRFGAPVWDRWLTHSDIGYGDGATAALLHRRDGTRDELVLEALTYSATPWLESMERGDKPFTRSPMEGRETIASNEERSQFYARYGKSMLPDTAREHVGESLRQAMLEADLDVADPRIRVVAVPRLGPRLVNVMYGGVLDGPLKDKVVYLGTRTGHLGAGDMLANLADIVEQKLLAPGEIAIVFGAGGGYTWSTAVVRAPEL